MPTRKRRVARPRRSPARKAASKRRGVTRANSGRAEPRCAVCKAGVWHGVRPSRAGAANRATTDLAADLRARGIHPARTVKVCSASCGDRYLAGERAASPSRRGRSSAKRAVKRNGKRPSLDTFTRAYLDAALWSSTDDDGTPLNRNYSISDIPAKELAKAVRDTKRFQRENDRWIGDESSQAGHDFWLTRNGHGSGYRDGHWPEAAEQHLYTSSKTFGEVNPYVHRGRIYFSP